MLTETWSLPVLEGGKPSPHRDELSSPSGIQDLLDRPNVLEIKDVASNPNHTASPPREEVGKESEARGDLGSKEAGGESKDAETAAQERERPKSTENASREKNSPGLRNSETIDLNGIQSHDQTMQVAAAQSKKAGETDRNVDDGMKWKNQHAEVQATRQGSGHGDAGGIATNIETLEEDGKADQIESETTEDIVENAEGNIKAKKDDPKEDDGIVEEEVKVVLDAQTEEEETETDDAEEEDVENGEAETEAGDAEAEEETEVLDYDGEREEPDVPVDGELEEEKTEVDIEAKGDVKVEPHDVEDKEEETERGGEKKEEEEKEENTEVDVEAQLEETKLKVADDVDEKSSEDADWENTKRAEENPTNTKKAESYTTDQSFEGEKEESDKAAEKTGDEGPGAPSPDDPPRTIPGSFPLPYYAPFNSFSPPTNSEDAGREADEEDEEDQPNTRTRPALLPGIAFPPQIFFPNEEEGLPPPPLSSQTPTSKFFYYSTHFPGGTGGGGGAVTDFWQYPFLREEEDRIRLRFVHPV